MYRPLRMTRADAQEMIGPESLHLYVLEVKKRQMSPRASHPRLEARGAHPKDQTPTSSDSPLPPGSDSGHPGSRHSERQLPKRPQHKVHKRSELLLSRCFDIIDRQ